MRPLCPDWLRLYLDPREVQGQRVLDVGSLDVNGTMRPLLEEEWGGLYTGVDMREGPNVDRVCRAEDLVQTFGEQAFNFVCCVDTLEHMEHWQECLAQMKRVCLAGGWLYVTTMAPGYAYHAHPGDFWRFGLTMLLAAFADCFVEAVNEDATFLLARKPGDWVARDFSLLEASPVFPDPAGQR